MRRAFRPLPSQLHCRRPACFFQVSFQRASGLRCGQDRPTMEEYSLVHYHIGWPFSIVRLYLPAFLLGAAGVAAVRYGYKIAVNPTQRAALFLRLLASQTASRPLRRLPLATRQWHPTTLFFQEKNGTRIFADRTDERGLDKNSIRKKSAESV